MGKFNHIHHARDLPIYPGAQEVSLTDQDDQPVSYWAEATECSTLEFVTSDIPSTVQKFYFDALGGSDYGWYGDGSNYSTHHVDHGDNVSFYIDFQPDDIETEVKAQICRRDE